MNKTPILWTECTWNPASGCTKISPECKYCYAELLAENKRGTTAFPRGFELTLRPWKLDEPERLRRASLVFTNSMTDMFLADISDDYRDRCFAAMRRAPWHRYQVLTKRPDIAARYFESREVPDTVWLGVTIGCESSMARLAILRSINARVRFVSAEPLIGPVDFTERLDGIHWVIGGGESGSHLSNLQICEQRGLVRPGGRGERRWVPREDRARWASDMRDACLAQGVAFFWKQWGGPTPKSSGRCLDGREWDEMPTVTDCMPDQSIAPRAGSRHHAKKLRRADHLPSNTTAV